MLDDENALKEVCLATWVKTIYPQAIEVFKYFRRFVDNSRSY